MITNLVLFIFTFITKDKVKNNMNLKLVKGKQSFSITLLGHNKLMRKILQNTAMLKKDLVLFIFMLFCYSSTFVAIVD